MTSFIHRLVVFLCLPLCVHGWGQPLQAAEPKITTWKVFPQQIGLQGTRARQRIVVHALASDGSTIDVTGKAKLRVQDNTIARLVDQRILPESDGTTKIEVQFAGTKKTVPVKVEDARVDRAISFERDVMPIFTRAGCNAGKCHGSAQGQNGFRLSLFGYDPKGDYFRLLREIPGRRINLARPENCLLVNKATGNIAHVGGQRIKPSTPTYDALVRWIKAGAKKDPETAPKAVSLEVLPKQIVLGGKEKKHRLLVQVRYSDGTSRDVTDLSQLLSNNDSIAKVSEDGVVEGGARGNAFILARFATLTQGTQVSVVPSDPNYRFPKLPSRWYNYIDDLVHKRLKQIRLKPAPRCSDEIFLRRVFIDTIGLLPTRAEYNRFMKDTNPKKRETLVDSLLKRDEFKDVWVMRWSELLQLRKANGLSSKGLRLYHDWLKRKIYTNEPVDKMVLELLGATGGTFHSPQANYFQTETVPTQIAENVAQVFLGIRIQCAQCHNHPFDRWTMDDYYGFAAFFGQIGFRPALDPREITIFHNKNGKIRHPVGKRVVSPKFLGGQVTKIGNEDPRLVLSKWLVSENNPQFARNLANIAWAHFMGKGIIDPVDDVRFSNPPSNPELLETLGRKLVTYKYDLRRLIRDICLSQTYQQSTQKHPDNPPDDRNFAQAYVRRIRAEILLDCINQVTGTKSTFSGHAKGTRAVQLMDGGVSTYFLTTFGRSKRESPCACEVKAEPTLSQALHLLNGKTVTQNVQECNLVSKLLARQMPPRKVIEELYVRCLSRRPTSAELQRLLKEVRNGAEQTQDLQDVFWALLNSKEFLFNH
ncbi:MAG: DUF1549 and DUF1553 domain-containing protein [Gemmataceae bacterium]